MMLAFLIVTDLLSFCGIGSGTIIVFNIAIVVFVLFSFTQYTTMGRRFLSQGLKGVCVLNMEVKDRPYSSTNYNFLLLFSNE
jgi:hypothetical protein